MAKGRKNPFTAHPNACGESYLQHAAFALRVSGETALISVIVFVHALFPMVFVRTGGERLRALIARLESRAAARAAGKPDA
jgi:hypothetical protein